MAVVIQDWSTLLEGEPNLFPTLPNSSENFRRPKFQNPKIPKFPEAFEILQPHENSKNPKNYGVFIF
jgi:hypothetical protein